VLLVWFPGAAPDVSSAWEFYYPVSRQWAQLLHDVIPEAHGIRYESHQRPGNCILVWGNFSAIKGFDYQAVVMLDVLAEEKHTPGILPGSRPPFVPSCGHCLGTNKQAGRAPRLISSY
jgi:hypothetical protein